MKAAFHLSSIRNVTAIMSEISAASIEQTSGIEQVNQAAAAAESLEEQAESLLITVGSFKVDDYSNNTLFHSEKMKGTNKETTLVKVSTLKESSSN